MAEGGEEDELDEDLEVLHITACKEKKASLAAEKERREECIERLQVKLKALNSELAARNEEVMTLRQQNDALVLEGEKENRADKGREADADDTPNGVREHKINRFMEEQLKEKAQKRSARNEYGMRMFDEMELMVQKPQDEQKREMAYIDTVLITWSKAPSAEQTYNLTYRVDRNMTSKKLREDACLYWGISEVEYILKTVTTNSKVQDDVTIQNCFRRDEDAHLMLVHKTPTKERPSEEELKAIRPKTGVKARKKQAQSKENADDKPVAAAHSADFAKQLDVVPGFKEFMLQRDQDVRGHLPALKLHSLCVFSILAVATLIVIFSIRQPNVEYICHRGVLSALSHPRTDPATGSPIPDFGDIVSIEEVWRWLQFTVPEELLVPSSRLRQDNYLPGWLELRMQQVATPSAETCGKTGLPVAGETCAADRYSSTTANKADLEAVKTAWVNRSGVGGRSADAVPWKFMDSPESSRLVRLAGGSGPFNSFDASGYAVQYNLQPANLTATREAYHDDMWILRNADWLTLETRSLQVHFVAYNGNHDNWLGSSFILEMSPTGVVFPRGRVTAYRPQFIDWHWRFFLIVDAVRFGLVLYICTWHLYRQISYEAKERKGVRFYRLICWRDFVDLLLGCVFVYIFGARYFRLGALEKTTAELAQELGGRYISVQHEAEVFRGHTIAEATVLGLALVRFLYCCRVNRHIFIIWETLYSSVKAFFGFALVTWPIFLAFVMLAHAIWGAEMLNNKTIWDSFTATLMMLCGDFHVMEVSAERRPWTLVFLVLFYCVLHLLFVNTWIAVVVLMYQKTRVAAGFNPKSYAWYEEDWVRWCLWSPLGQVWRWLRPRRRDLDEA